MLPEMFWCFSKKTYSFTKKVSSSQKIKRVKNVIIKKSATKVFQVCIDIVYDSFILDLRTSISISTGILFGYNVKYGLLSRDSFQIKRQYDGWKNLTVTSNFLKK